MSALPLAGLRVLELGTVVAGPVAGGLLADLGADVVKVEAPGSGDALRQMGPSRGGVPLWWGVNSRGKRCIALDLKSPAGNAVFRELAAGADVLVENYRAGVLARLGFDWPALHQLNPRLVMLSISGFGQTGPKSSRPGFGKIAEGMSGIVHLTGSPDDRPLVIGFSLGDASTALVGIFGAMLALYRRDALGCAGARIDVALYEPLLRILECQHAVEAATGEPPVRRGTNDPYQWGAATRRPLAIETLRAADGRWWAVLIPSGDVAARVAVLVDGKSGERLDADAAAAGAALREWARGRTSEPLVDALRAAGVEIAPVHDGLSIAADPYFVARGDVLPTEHPAAGRLSVPGFVTGDADPGPDRTRFRAPAVGDDDAAVFADWLGLDGARTTELCDSLRAGHPLPTWWRGSRPAVDAPVAADATADQPGLAGLVVVELSDSVGACFAASLLADFGADVIACEALPSGSGARRLGPGPVADAWWRILARGKRSVAVSPSDAESLDAVRRLIERADLIVTDVAPAAEHGHPLGSLLTPGGRAQVLRIFPPGADRPDLWPWSRRPELAAAASGLMALTGWRDGPPLQPEVPLVDGLAGVLGAIRSLARLRERALGTGRTEPIDVALHQALQRLIDWQVVIATGTGCAQLRNGNSFPLNAGIGNMHRTRDGKYVATSAANQAVADRLLAMIGGTALRDDPRFATTAARAHGLDALYAIIDDWVAQRTVAEVMEAATRHDVVVGPIHDPSDIATDPQIAARGNLVTVASPAGPLAMPAPVPAISGVAATVRHPGPHLGAHTAEVLARYASRSDQAR